MKRILIVAFALLGFALNATAQNSPTAKIKFSEREHAFGDIYQGDVVEHTFVIENTGDAPLVLTNVSTTCGCTAPKWPREPIAPGESADLLIKFNSSGKMGMQNKVITIFSNSENPQERIKITTNVLPKKVEGDSN